MICPPIGPVVRMSLAYRTKTGRDCLVDDLLNRIIFPRSRSSDELPPVPRAAAMVVLVGLPGIRSNWRIDVEGFPYVEPGAKAL